MKKLSFVLLCFCILTKLELFAQNSKVGISGGVNFSKFYYPTNFAPFSFKLGSSANLFYEKGIMKHLDISAGIGYDSHGNLYIGTLSYGNGVSQNYELKWTNNYLSIPLLLKPYIGDKVRGYAIVGLNFAFLINHNFSNNQDISLYSSDPVGSQSAEFSSFELAQIIGIGIEMTISEKLSLGAEVASYRGYTSLYTNQSNWSNLAFMSNIVVKYHLGN